MVLCFKGSYWTMDGPADVSELRAPKRPYPDEEEETQEVRLYIIGILLK